MGLAPHLLGTARFFRSLTSGRPAKRSDQPLPRIERAPSQARHTHLVATETDGRSVLSSGPSRMAFDRRTPLGDCVPYVNV